jgi:hypothetical protein
MNNRRIKTDQQKQDNKINERERYQRNKSMGIIKKNKNKQAGLLLSYYYDNDKKIWRSVLSEKYVYKSVGVQSYAVRENKTEVAVCSYKNFTTKLKNSGVKIINGKYDVIIEPDNDFVPKNSDTNTNKRKNTEVPEVSKRPKLIHTENQIANYPLQNRQEMINIYPVNTQIPAYPYYQFYNPQFYNPQLFFAVKPQQQQVQQIQQQIQQVQVQQVELQAKSKFDIRNVVIDPVQHTTNQLDRHVHENNQIELKNNMPACQNANQYTERLLAACSQGINIDKADLDVLFENVQESDKNFNTNMRLKK